MLSILGTPRRLCNGRTRREVLCLGGLSSFGVSLNNSVALGGQQPTRGANKAKACILLFPYGSAMAEARRGAGLKRSPSAVCSG